MDLRSSIFITSLVKLYYTDIVGQLDKINIEMHQHAFCVLGMFLHLQVHVPLHLAS